MKPIFAPFRGQIINNQYNYSPYKGGSTCAGMAVAGGRVEFSGIEGSILPIMRNGTS